MAEYFFELLLEEIPAWMHDAAQAALQQQFAPVLGGSPIVHSTPRRLIVYLPNIPERELDREEEVKGPPAKAAYDAEGKPTPALHGFLKKNSATIDDVIAGGDYVRVRRKVKGRTAGEILQQHVPRIIEGLRWPKMMRWGAGEHSYIRPIHSILSMLDGAHLPVTIFGVASGTSTVGHRTLAPRPFAVKSYNDYVTQLELARVVIDARRRREVMAQRALVLASQVRGTPAPAPGSHRAARAPAIPREARRLPRQDRAHRQDRRGHGRRRARARRGAPLQDRSRHRDGQGVHRAAGAHRRHLRSRGRPARSRVAGDLRSLPAGQRRRSAATQHWGGDGLARRPL